MIYRGLIIIATFLAISACKKNDTNVADYRTEFIGSYDCTKSNISFEDDQFTTEIDDITIELDATSDSLVIMNGASFLINSDGTTITINDDTVFYKLSFEGRVIKLLTYLIIPGDPAYCYIMGDKI